MDADRFRQLLTTEGPFASVYFEDTHDTEDAETQLDLKWRGIREELLDHGAGETVVAYIEDAVKNLRAPVGRSGRAIVAGADGVAINEHLLRPAATAVVRVSELPYLVPMVEHAMDFPTYVLASVDHTGADITLHRNGNLGSETVDGGGHPVHKAAGAESSGYDQPQRRAEEAARKNTRAAADRVTELVDKTAAELVFVVGEVRSRSDFQAELPQHVAGRAIALEVGARHSGHDFGEVEQAIEAKLIERRNAELDDIAATFTAEIGRQSGLAAEGLGPVCSALRQGAVETLIIGELRDATVVADAELTTIAPTPEVLSEQGAAPAKTLRADEALPFVAVSIGAALVRTDERIAPADGIGAVLRYAPTLH